MTAPDFDTADKLRLWWHDTAKAEVNGMLPKLREYGSDDLRAIGQQIAALADTDVDDTAAYELGVLFYLIGKVQRAVSAAHAGRPASDDTWHDIVVYAKMVLAKRAGVMP